MQRKLSLILLVISTTACAVNVGPSNIRISDDIRFDLLPPASFGEEFSLTQLAEITVADETRDMLFVTEISGQTMAVVGLMPNGTRLFTVIYDGISIHTDNEGYDSSFDYMPPAYLLADFQLSQWPISLLRTVLNRSSPCFSAGDCEFVESADGLHRSLRQAGEEILSISYGGAPYLQNTIELSHWRRDYHITLTSLNVEPPAE